MLLCLAACSSDDDEPADIDSPTRLPVFAGCENEFHGACDVLDGECQSRLFATVRCLRGQPEATLPEVRVITKEELIEEIATEAARSTEASGDAALGDADGDAVVIRAIELLGLAQPGELSYENADQVFIDTVPAYYSDVVDLVTIVDDGSQDDAAGKSLTLVHELVHALQDQDGSLAALGAESAPNFDAYLAALSMAEGEATMLESFVDAAQWGFEQDPDFRGYYLSWVPNAEEAFAGQSPLVISPRYFPYSYGARYVFDLFGAEGMAGVRARFGAQPTSVLPMLLNEAGPVDVQPESFAALAVPEAPAGYVAHEPDAFGPWVFGKFLERVLPEVAGTDLRSHWRGDRLLVWESADFGIAAGWTIRLDTEAAADELFEPARAHALAGMPATNAFCVRAGRDVTIGVTDGSSTRDLWIATLGGTSESSDAASDATTPPDEAAPTPSAAPPRLRPRHHTWRGRPSH